MQQPARYYVKVSVFILPGANMANNRLEKDFQIARDVWGIDFDMTRYTVNNLIFNNLTSRDFGCEGRGDTEIEQLLFQLKRTVSPDPHTIAVFYIGTDIISNFTRACTKRRRVPNSPHHQPTFMNAILLSNTVAPDSFAHELGHVFFFSSRIDREDSDLTIPGIQHHVDGNPHNIMAPGDLRRYPTTATPEQIQRALQSNSPQIIFDRMGDYPYFMPLPRSSNRRSFNDHQNPYVGQWWAGFYD